MVYLLIPAYLEIQAKKSFCDGVFSLQGLWILRFFENLVRLSGVNHSMLLK